jgi:hypothetical protein
MMVFFARRDDTVLHWDSGEIDQSIPIVAETEHIPNRRNSRLKSRAQISDGSARRFSSCAEKLTLLDQCVTLGQNNRVGMILIATAARWPLQPDLIQIWRIDLNL